jgi:hypothetical protein
VTLKPRGGAKRKVVSLTPEIAIVTNAYRSPATASNIAMAMENARFLPMTFATTMITHNVPLKIHAAALFVMNTSKIASFLTRRPQACQ